MSFTANQVSLASWDTVDPEIEFCWQRTLLRPKIDTLTRPPALSLRHFSERCILLSLFLSGPCPDLRDGGFDSNKVYCWKTVVPAESAYLGIMQTEASQSGLCLRNIHFWTFTNRDASNDHFHYWLVCQLVFLIDWSIQCLFFKWLILSEHQSNTQRYSIYNHIKQRKAENSHIWESGTSTGLECLLEKWLKQWINY